MRFFSINANLLVVKQNDKVTKEENILSRDARSLINRNDDAVESELGDPDCTIEIIDPTDGKQFKIKQ